MRRAVLAAAVALAASVPLPAHAAADSTYLGGCSYSAFGEDGRMGGEVDIRAVVYSPTSGDPVSATFTCAIRVNGVPQPTAILTASGTVAVAGVAPIAYEAQEWDVVELCETVDYTGPGDTTPTAETCRSSVPVVIPPPCCHDPVSAPVCYTLPRVAGSYGPVLVEPDGDVHVAGEPQWDCPPYDEWPPS